MGIVAKVKKWDIQICKFNIALFLRAMILLLPITLLFYQENGLTVKELFFFQGIFYLVSIILETPIGYLSDRLPRKVILLSSYLIFFAVITLWLFFHGFWIILCGEIMTAISKVMLDNAQSGYLYDYLKTKERKDKMPKNYGYLNFSISSGTAIAAIAGTWIYIHFGTFTILLTELVLLMISICLVLSLPSIYKPVKHQLKILTRFKIFYKEMSIICSNKSIVYYVLYSGFLIGFSIVFSLSFQPLILNAMAPVFLFGVAAFCNHGIRAVFSVLTGKISKFFGIRSMIIPLYISYLLAFGCIFAMMHIRNTKIIAILILFICLVIGCQLLFTIRHVSRLHTFVSSKSRGKLISVNNTVSRTMAFIILFSSKVFMNKLGFEIYYLIILGIFIFVGLFLVIKAYSIKENV